MATFDAVKALVKLAEGGDSNSKSDLGGFTRLGISTRQYPDLNIASLSDDQCYLILKQDYWDHYRIGEIVDQTIANQVFLLIINMSPLNAGRIVQSAVNGIGRGYVAVSIDGILGTSTLQAINKLPAPWLSDRIRTESGRYYLSLTDSNPSQVPNFRGWMRRVLL